MAVELAGGRRGVCLMQRSMPAEPFCTEPEWAHSAIATAELILSSPLQQGGSSTVEDGQGWDLPPRSLSEPSAQRQLVQAKSCGAAGHEGKEGVCHRPIGPGS